MFTNMIIYNCVEVYLLYYIIHVFSVIQVNSNLLDTNSSVKVNHASYNNQQNLCLTPICIQEAARIIQSLDDTVSPCDDFYRFSCGKWMSSAVIPDHKSSLNSFNDLQELINYRLKGLFDGIGTNDSAIVRKAKDYYDSCMNTTLIEQIGDKPLRDLLDQLIGDNEWPLDLSANSTTILWSDLYLKLRDLGLINSMLFTLSVSTDIRNNTRKVLTLDQPSFGLSRDSLLSDGIDTSYVAYRELMTKSVAKLATNQSITQIESTVDSIIEFERTLANISMAKELRRNLTVILYEMNVDFDGIDSDFGLDNSLSREERDYLKSVYNRVAISKLQHISPNIDWLQIIAYFISGANITESDEIILNDTSFIQRLNKLINATNNRLLVNYIVWRVILSKQMSLTEDWVQMRRQYERIIHGTGSSRPRWHQCVKTVDTALPALVSHLYIKHYFSTDIKQKASELIDNVKLEFKHTLTTRQAWLDRQTMDRALDKLNKMRIIVGYPEQVLNETSIDQIYEMLAINSSDFFGNIMHINQWKHNSTYNSLRNPNDIHDWRRVSSLAMANAFYNTVKNTVVIPAGILEGVFYHKDRPNYLNYGSIAKTAAHEIIHGFDSHGRHFDADGNVNYWWTGDTDRHYRHKAKCFVRQYGDYYVDHLGLGVNGARTQAENIADNGGIKLAFSAYERYVRVNGPEPGLPALPYTPEQLFWVSYGTHYCAKHNKESLKNLILNDSHTPKQYRINGALSNSHDFSRVFNCPLGSPMNSVHKCSVW